MTVMRILLWGLTLALVAMAAWAWPGLPERIPLHFGADGLPDRWGERSVWGWFLLPALGVAMAALMDGIGRWSVRHPEKQTINLPQSGDLMALPLEYRIPVLKRAAAVLAGVGVAMLAAFCLFQIGSYAASHGEPSQGWTLAGLGVCMLGSIVGLAGGMVAISSELDRQKRAARDA